MFRLFSKDIIRLTTTKGKDVKITFCRISNQCESPRKPKRVASKQERLFSTKGVLAKWKSTFDSVQEAQRYATYQYVEWIKLPHRQSLSVAQNPRIKYITHIVLGRLHAKTSLLKIGFRYTLPTSIVQTNHLPQSGNLKHEYFTNPS